MGIRGKGAVAALVLAIGGVAGPAMATPATLSISGTLDGSLGGSACVTDCTLTDVSFTMTEDFDTSQDVGHGSTVVYSEALIFAIPSVGSYTVEPSDNLDVTIVGPPNSPSQGTYGIFFPSQNGPLNTFYDTATPHGSQTVYSDLQSDTQPSGPYFLEDLDGAGSPTLTVTDFVSLGDVTESLVSAPEPASLAMLGFGIVAMAPLRRRRRR